MKLWHCAVLGGVVLVCGAEAAPSLEPVFPGNDRAIASPESQKVSSAVSQAAMDLPERTIGRDGTHEGEYGFNWRVNGIKPDGKRKFPHAPPGTYCAAGHSNNCCFIIPEWNMVIVRLGLDGSGGDQVWDAFLGKVGESLMP